VVAFTSPERITGFMGVYASANAGTPGVNAPSSLISAVIESMLPARGAGCRSPLITLQS
jgi:hypothetical protein